MIPYIYRPGTSITFFYDKDGDAQMHTIDITAPIFKEAVTIIQNGSESDIPDLLEMVNIRKFVAHYSDGLVKISNENEVLINGFKVAESIVERILEMKKQGEDFTAVARFADKLQSNPNKEVREDLYKWLAESDLPLTSDGNFIAYKKVQDDFWSYRSGKDGKVFHGPSELVKMPREDCDEDRTVTCSSGLHFCSFSYLSKYMGSSGKVMAVMINPANVTSIPVDYNLAKGRCCEYFVMNELDKDSVRGAFGGSMVYHSHLGAEEEIEEEEEEEEEYSEEDFLEYDFGYDDEDY